FLAREDRIDQAPSDFGIARRDLAYSTSPSVAGDFPVCFSRDGLLVGRALRFAISAAAPAAVKPVLRSCRAFSPEPPSVSRLHVAACGFGRPTPSHCFRRVRCLQTTQNVDRAV